MDIGCRGRLGWSNNLFRRINPKLGEAILSGKYRLQQPSYKQKKATQSLMDKKLITLGGTDFLSGVLWSAT